MCSLASSPDRPSHYCWRRRENVMLANAQELLAGSKASARKLHCHDLWDKRMQKEAANILLRKNDSRVQRYRREKGKLLYPTSPEPAQLSPRTACFLRPLKPFSKTSHTLSFDTLPTLCTTQLEASAGLRSSLDRASIRLCKQRAILRADLTDLKEFMKDEVSSYKQNCSLQLSHFSAFKVANKKKVFGVQFYEAQRRRGYEHRTL